MKKLLLLSTAVAFVPTAAFAQSTGTQETEKDTIVVTGFRRALENAINKKKNSEQIVESVSAEDIGKLPDASIGESIARLPGLTSQRLNGRSAFISIRGFGPEFSTTLLNGREQTSTNDNRGVEFDQFPSEVVSRVDVYKTFTTSTKGIEMDNMHDLNFVDNGTRALFFYDEEKNVSAVQSEAIGLTDRRCKVRENSFREIDLTKDWEVVFSWSSADHMDLEESSFTDGDRSIVEDAGL